MAGLTGNIKRFLLPALLVGAIVISLLKPTTDSLSQIAQKIKNKLNDVELVFNEATKDTALLSALANGHEGSPLIEKIEKQGIDLFYYQNDTLIHWTTKNILPPANLTAIETGTSFIKLRNGWYQMMKWHDSISRQTLLGLLPVKNQYPFENKFLKNDFVLGLDVPHNIEISEQKISGSIPIKNLKGKVLFREATVLCKSCGIALPEAFVRSLPTTK